MTYSVGPGGIRPRTGPTGYPPLIAFACLVFTLLGFKLLVFLVDVFLLLDAISPPLSSSL
jgi:hypothetical protein